MHGGLYVERPVSLCLAWLGAMYGAVKAPGLSAAFPLLVVIKQILSDGLMVAILDD